MAILRKLVKISNVEPQKSDIVNSTVEKKRALVIDGQTIKSY